MRSLQREKMYGISLTTNQSVTSNSLHPPAPTSTHQHQPAPTGANQCPTASTSTIQHHPAPTSHHLHPSPTTVHDPPPPPTIHHHRHFGFSMPLPSVAVMHRITRRPPTPRPSLLHHVLRLSRMIKFQPTSKRLALSPTTTESMPYDM